MVVLDPGHNGGNAGHPGIIDALVPAGNGQRKPCNTTGTATDTGYPEHAFTFSVAAQVRSLLRQHGITVVQTRYADTGVGPCVNIRARIGNQANATAVVSIHGDGASAFAHGFHIMTAADDPAGAAMASQSHQLAADVHAGMIRWSGISTATYAGSDGYDTRSDLAGLTLSTRPTIMIECGNMRNAHDAAIMTSQSGRDRIATSIASGILSYLHIAE